MPPMEDFCLQVELKKSTHCLNIFRIIKKQIKLNKIKIYMSKSTI